ncbi:unnamed protein product, partial [Ixodes hexagonus]
VPVYYPVVTGGGGGVDYGGGGVDYGGGVDIGGGGEGVDIGGGGTEVVVDEGGEPTVGGDETVLYMHSDAKPSVRVQPTARQQAQRLPQLRRVKLGRERVVQRSTELGLGRTYALTPPRSAALEAILIPQLVVGYPPFAPVSLPFIVGIPYPVYIPVLPTLGIGGVGGLGGGLGGGFGGGGYGGGLGGGFGGLGGGGPGIFPEDAGYEVRAK